MWRGGTRAGGMARLTWEGELPPGSTSTACGSESGRSRRNSSWFAESAETHLSSHRRRHRRARAWSLAAAQPAALPAAPPPAGDLLRTAPGSGRGSAAATSVRGAKLYEVRGAQLLGAFPTRRGACVRLLLQHALGVPQPVGAPLDVDDVAPAPLGWDADRLAAPFIRGVALPAAGRRRRRRASAR